MCFVNAPQEQDFKITPAQLESAITDKTRALILCTPSNPTGAVYSKEELKGDWLMFWLNIQMLLLLLMKYMNM